MASNFFEKINALHELLTNKEQEDNVLEAQEMIHKILGRDDIDDIPSLIVLSSKELKGMLFQVSTSEMKGEVDNLFEAYQKHIYNQNLESMKECGDYDSDDEEHERYYDPNFVNDQKSYYSVFEYMLEKEIIIQVNTLNTGDTYGEQPWIYIGKMTLGGKERFFKLYARACDVHGFGCLGFDARITLHVTDTIDDLLRNVLSFKERELVCGRIPKYI